LDKLEAIVDFVGLKFQEVQPSAQFFRIRLP